MEGREDPVSRQERKKTWFREEEHCEDIHGQGGVCQHRPIPVSQGDDLTPGELVWTLQWAVSNRLLLRKKLPGLPLHRVLAHSL